MLARRLRAEFGNDEVFRDITSIPPGQTFAEFIGARLEGCVVMLVLIGTQWLRITDDAGKRRLEDPEDWVRKEIVAALQRDILVVPVLLCGAVLPAATDLPEDLRPLVERNAVTMSDDDFEHDVEQLIAALRRHPALAGKRADKATATATGRDRIRDLIDRIPDVQHEMSRKRPGILARALRKLVSLLQFATLVAIAVWIGYTQSDPFAAGVDRFFVRSGEMLRRLLE